MAHYIFAGLFLISPLIIYTGLPYPHTLPRFIWLAIICTSWCAYLVYKRHSIKLTSIDLSFFGFITALAVSTIFSANPLHSFWGSLERSFAFSLWLFLACAYIGLKYLWAHQRGPEFIWKTTICVIAAMCLWGSAQIAIPGFGETFSGSRIGGTSGNAIFFGMYLTLGLGLAVYFQTTETAHSSRAWRIFALVTLFISIITILLTRSTGALLGCIAGGSVLIFLYLREYKNTTVALIFAVSLVVATVSGTYYSITHDLFNTATFETRLINWRIAMKGFSHHPILGYGYEYYRAALDTFFDPHLTNRSLSETYADKPHNMHVELLVTTGLVGMTAYGILLITIIIALVRLYKKNIISRPQYLILLSLLAAREVQNAGAFETHGTIILFILMISFISHRAESLVSADSYKKINRPILLILLFTTLPSTVYGAVIPIVDINNTQQLTHLEKIQLSPYQSDLFTIAAYEITGKYWQRADLFALMNATERAVWEKNAQLLRTLIDDLHIEHLTRAEWQLKLGQTAFQLFLITQNTVDAERATAILQKSHELSPHRQEPLLLLGQIAIQQNNTSAAFAFLDTAAALDPKLGLPHWYRGLAAFAANDPQIGWKSIEKALQLEYTISSKQIANYIYNQLLKADMTEEAAKFSHMINN